MNFYIGVTDDKWFEYLSELKPDELNFWRPGGKQAFRALKPNELFLFKLHSPFNFIVGGGFFVRHSFLPMSLAWEAFERKNGASNYFEFRDAINKYRKPTGEIETDPTIGCIILAMPFFFKRQDWIPAPKNWHPSIVQGKTYSTSEPIGRSIYNQVQKNLNQSFSDSDAFVVRETNENRYGAGQIVYPRIGQGAFRVLVTEAYHRRCAITGEKTLPVLEASHIKPYALNGPHLTSNGLLLRKDVHTLFDRGYITINEELRIEVSRKIKDDYGNGKEYYEYHGKELIEVPQSPSERPSVDFLRWHNENVYLA